MKLEESLNEATEMTAINISRSHCTFMEWIYDFAFGALSYLVGLIFVFFARGRVRLKERFGYWDPIVGTNIAWFHGASVGEVGSLLPIIKQFRSENPQFKILLTSTSATGLDRGLKDVDYCRMLPFDNSRLVRRATTGWGAKYLFFGETEIWPSLLRELDIQGTKLFLVNGRISERSLKGYRLVRPLFKTALARLTKLFVVDEHSRLRFESLGANSSQVLVVGNAKNDRRPQIDVESAKLTRQKEFTNGYPVITLGCLRPGEEDVWFQAILDALKLDVNLNVIIAPRHLEKLEYFADRLKRFGIFHARWSTRSTSRSNIYLIDVMGELEKLYALSDVVFVGGTLLPDYGGHNPLEPAMYGACVVLGPYGSVIEELRALMQKSGAVIELSKMSEARSVIDRLCKGDLTLRQIGENGKRVWIGQAGATKKILDWCSKCS